MTTPPDTDRTRVRLHGGRVVHAVEPFGESLRTVCWDIYGLAARNHWLPPETAVTCKACVRRLAGEGQ